jgi:hypothetical protein
VEKAASSSKKSNKPAVLRPIPPPRTRISTTPTPGRKAFATVRPESDIVDAGLACTHRDTSQTNGLPDKHRSLHMPLAPLEGKKLSKKAPAMLMQQQQRHPLMSDESHDYSEIYTPNDEDEAAYLAVNAVRSWVDPDSASAADISVGRRTGSGDSGLTGLSSTGTETAAPPLPLHRYPSWEDRIYQVAKDGFPADAAGGNDDEDGNKRNSMCGGFGNDISVPVYASVKGVGSTSVVNNCVE